MSAKVGLSELRTTARWLVDHLDARALQKLGARPAEAERMAESTLPEIVRVLGVVFEHRDRLRAVFGPNNSLEENGIR